MFERLSRLRTSPRPWMQTVQRYAVPLAAVAAVAWLLPRVDLPRPVPGVLTMGVVLYAAWRGGLGPALCIGPLLFVTSRVVEGKPWVPTGQEFVAMLVITLVTCAVGLAGEFRRRVQEITARSDRRLREQAEALSLAHIVFRDMSGRVTDWNDGAARMFGWKPDEALGQDLARLLQIRFPLDAQQAEASLRETGQWEGEVTVRRKDGAELRVIAHWILYRDQEGGPVGVAELYNDVTELRRAEEAVRAADRRKDEFLATLAHELRNPLAPIRTGLELMKAAAADPERLEEVRGMMERQTEQLISLVDDLLDVSRITRGRMELRKESVCLQRVISSAVEASRPLTDAAGHSLEVHMPERDIHLNADPHRLAQVVSNLLNNAARYTPRGGRIGLELQAGENEALIRVRDTGVGIPAEMLDRIFEMFTQAGREKDSGDAGLGIGLTLARTLVEMHGGRIEVCSGQPGEGSEFTVRLPLEHSRCTAAPAPVVAKPAATSAPSAGRRVLIVDDNQAACRLLSMMIRNFGHDVRTAADGVEGIALAQSFQPHVVLMDLGMPRMNGFEAARRIREAPWGRDMLLVAISGWGQESDKQRTREAGFDAHLTKPAEPAELRRLIDGVGPCSNDGLPPSLSGRVRSSLSGQHDGDGRVVTGSLVSDS